jgi:NADPH:quinone reductase
LHKEAIMKAICVTSDRKLEVRNLPTPETPAPGHILVDIDAATITHGDKFFLTVPLPGGATPARGPDIYGANGGGRVVATGEGVPSHYAGKQVAIYRGFRRTADSTGLWCERAQVHHASALILPEGVSARDYCGSLANIVTVYAFLADVVAGRHKGILVTAGNSATGNIMASRAKIWQTPAIFLARTDARRDELIGRGVQHVLSTGDPGFKGALQALAEKIGATAVFDGIGGDLLTDILPVLPVDTAVYVYGFLGGPKPISLTAAHLMGRNLSFQRFSNFMSPTVRDEQRLAAALATIGSLIGDPMFKTRIGKEFSFDQIDEAMAYSDGGGGRALLV